MFVYVPTSQVYRKALAQASIAFNIKKNSSRLGWGLRELAWVCSQYHIWFPEPI